MDFKALLDQITAIPDQEYLDYIQTILANKEDIPICPAHIEQEKRVRSDKELDVVCSMNMPPDIQVLKLEEFRLRDELHLVSKEGGVGGDYYNDLLRKKKIVDLLINDWINEELEEKPDILYILRQKKPMYLIGNHWRMLVVVSKKKNKIQPNRNSQ